MKDERKAIAERVGETIRKMIREGEEKGKTIMESEIVQSGGDLLMEKMRIAGEERVSDRKDRDGQREEEDVIMSKYGLIELLNIVIGSLIMIEEEEDDDDDDGDDEQGEREEGRGGGESRRRREERGW